MTDIGFLGISPSGLVKSAFDYAIKQIESGAEDVVRDVLGKVISSTTNPGLGKGGWFDGLAGKLVPVEEMVIAPLLFAATIGAVLRQDMRRLAKAWLVHLPLAAIGGCAVVQLASLGLAVTDALSASVQHQVDPHLAHDFASVLIAGLAASVASSVLSLFICVLFLMGTLAIWVELAMRSASIEVAVLFMPLAFAGLVWPATAHWAKRMLEILAALLLAKPVIVGTLCLGAAALTSLSGVSAAVEGATILLMSVFAPWAVLKIVPMVETSAIAHLEGVSHRLRQAPHQASMMAQRGAAIASGAAAPAAAAAGAGAGAGLAGGTAAGWVGSGLGGRLTGVAAHLVSQFGARRGDHYSGGADEPVDDPLGPARFPPGAKPAEGSGTRDG